MALEIEPPPASAGRASAPGAPAEALVIGLINNMPDSALEGTEQQFSRLLGAAAARRRVRLRYSFLAEVPRGTEARALIDARYWTLPELLQGPVDALIVTGTEPRSPSLREEPYWNRLGQLLEFAERSTISSIWSCLAAHAAALHLDGVERVRFSQKLCGVYAHSITRRPLADTRAVVPIADATFPMEHATDRPIARCRLHAAVGIDSDRG